jgi:hypothetical protein
MRNVSIKSAIRKDSIQPARPVRIIPPGAEAEDWHFVDALKMQASRSRHEITLDREAGRVLRRDLWPCRLCGAGATVDSNLRGVMDHALAGNSQKPGRERPRQSE